MQKKHLILSLTIALLFGFSIFLHECIHYAVAYAMGEEQIQITYHRVYGASPYRKELREILKKNWDEKAEKLKESFPEKARYLSLKEKIIKDDIIVNASAPLTLFFIATLAWSILFFKPHLLQNNSLLGKVLFPISTILGAEVLQGLRYTLLYLLDNQGRYNNDLVRTATWLDLPSGLFLYTTSTLASLMLGILIFKILPKPERMPVMIAGAVGAFVGYVIWYHLLGVWLLPDIPPTAQ